MFLKVTKILMFLGLVGFLIAVPVHGDNNWWYIIHGEILQVFSEQGKILLESEGEKLILVLEADCAIFRRGCPTSLESLRPVSAEDFQDALCWVNPRGFIARLWANYTVFEENGRLVVYDIFGNVK